MIFDYAKVRAVVEDRRSMLGALDAAVGFIRRNYGAGGRAVRRGLSAVRRWSSPATRWSRPAPAAARTMGWIAFAIGQVYIAARLWVKLVFWAQRDVAFSGAAWRTPATPRAPAPTWPDSPAADAIRG